VPREEKGRGQKGRRLDASRGPGIELGVHLFVPVCEGGDRIYETRRYIMIKIGIFLAFKAKRTSHRMNGYEIVN
jgi:hypothetical protein